MTPFSALLAELRPIPDGFSTEIPGDWRQGRTTYGGLSAALCLETAQRGQPELPPLRSAQFAFIGPAAGGVELRLGVLRRGKSAVFVAADLLGEAGIATHATLCFGAGRDSALHWVHLPKPPVPAPDAAQPREEGAPPGLPFLQHFEVRLAAGAPPGAGASAPEILLWIRHRDASASGMAALIALADAPPPAALTAMQRLSPISTMTWMLDVLAEPRGGWHLVRSAAETVAEGYSAQTLTVWAEDGTPLIASRQMVAVFG